LPIAILLHFLRFLAVVLDLLYMIWQIAGRDARSLSASHPHDDYYQTKNHQLQPVHQHDEYGTPLDPTQMLRSHPRQQVQHDIYFEPIAPFALDL
jgi:hypothetical protein